MIHVFTLSHKGQLIMHHKFLRQMVTPQGLCNSYQEELTPVSVETSLKGRKLALLSLKSKFALLPLKSSPPVEGLCPSEKQPVNFKFYLFFVI